MIATSAALDAEQNTVAASTAAATPTMPGGGFMPVLPGLPSMPLAQTAYRAQTVTQSVSVEETVAAQPVPVHAEDATGRMVPGSMAPGGGMGEAERAVRAGAAPTPRPGDAMHMETGIEAAPPVLGGVAEQNAPAQGTAQS